MKHQLEVCNTSKSRYHPYESKNFVRAVHETQQTGTKETDQPTLTDDDFAQSGMNDFQMISLCDKYLISENTARHPLEGRDPEFGRTLLMLLIRDKWFNAAAKLFEHIVDVTMEQKTKDGNSDVLENDNYVDTVVQASYAEEGFTALHYAVVHEDTPVSLIIQLVDEGADIDATTTICEQRQQEEYEALCDGDLSFQKGSIFGRTPLALCKQGGRNARVLLSLGANPNTSHYRAEFVPLDSSHEDRFEDVQVAQPLEIVQMVRYRNLPEAQHAIKAKFSMFSDSTLESFLVHLGDVIGTKIGLKSNKITFVQLAYDSEIHDVDTEKTSNVRLTEENWDDAVKALCALQMAYGSNTSVENCNFFAIDIDGVL